MDTQPTAARDSAAVLSPTLNATHTDVPVKYDPATNTLITNSTLALGGSQSLKSKVYKQAHNGLREYFHEVSGPRDGDAMRSLRNFTMRVNGNLPALTQMDSLTESFGNAGTIFGPFVSGLLAGMAAVTLLHLSVLGGNEAAGDRHAAVMRHYAPVAMHLGRVYWVLISLALASSTCRAAWLWVVLDPNTLATTAPAIFAALARALSLRTTDALATAAYSIAFLLNVLETPVNLDLWYAAARGPQALEAPLNAGFKRRMTTWLAMNYGKCTLLLLAWALVLWESQPRITARMLRALQDDGGDNRIGRVWPADAPSNADGPHANQTAKQHASPPARPANPNWRSHDAIRSGNGNDQDHILRVRGPRGPGGWSHGGGSCDDCMTDNPVFVADVRGAAGRGHSPQPHGSPLRELEPLTVFRSARQMLE